MKKNDSKKSTKKILLIIVVIAVLIICVVAIKNIKSKNNEEKAENEKSSEEISEELKAINFYEEFSKIENVENLENVVWNSIRITQIENKMQVSVLLNNQSKNSKVEKTNLTVNLYDKEGNVAYSKVAEMDEIKANYGTTTLNLEFDIDEILVIYDVKIIANK